MVIEVQVQRMLKRASSAISIEGAEVRVTQESGRQLLPGVFLWAKIASPFTLWQRPIICPV
jgi:hypothetical protein